MTTASVALCTYNGAVYLPEQLASIAGQTRPPDELVVCDDGSTDETVTLLEAFRDEAGFPVHIHHNPKRLGSTKNFEKAIGLCTGSVIFLSDQDDIWHREKLALSLARLEEHPEYGAVFANADLIDERGFAMGRFLWETLGFGEERREMFRRGRASEILLEGNVVTGATMGFRGTLRELILPIPEGWVQDAWIALVIACVADLGMVLEPVVRYRIHAGQQIGVPFPAAGSGPLAARARMALHRAQLLRRMRTNERPTLQTQATRFDALAQRISQHAGTFPPKEGVLEDLQGKARHFEVRARMPAAGRRWPAVARELRAGRYHRYSSGLPAAVKDLLLLDRGAPPVVMEDAWARTETPTVILLDIPGTGGSAIRDFLQVAYGAGTFVPTTADGGVDVMRQRLRQEPHVASRPLTARTANLSLLRGLSAAQLRRFQALIGPFWFGVHEFLEPQPWMYIAMLRDPVDRVISLYNEQVGQGSHVSLERWLDEVGPLSNEQTRRLAPPGDEQADVRSAPCTDETLERAKLNVARHFAVAGVAERFDETLVLLLRALGIPRRRLSVAGVPRAAEDRTNVPDHAIRRIEEMNTYDAELHRFASDRLETRLRLDEEAIGREVARLRRRNARGARSLLGPRRRG